MMTMKALLLQNTVSKKAIAAVINSQEDDDFYYEVAEEADESSENISQTSSQEDDGYGYESSDGYELYSPLYDSFTSVYRCYPVSFIEKTHLECGDKIIMPVEALGRLLHTQFDYPMQFQIQNQTTRKVSHCGVYEFTGEEEATVYLPNWMMENLKLQEGDFVNMKNETLEKGTYMKLQPHTMDFMGIGNPKAVLEETFRSFSCLTVGDTIMINHDSKNFYINVVETKPSNAINIIDTDCEVDFALPLDYKEPEKSAPKKALAKDPKLSIKFIPFTGAARRLDGNPSVHITSSVQNNLPSVQNKSKELVKEGVRAETSKQQRFQPFTGKKYTLIS